MSKKWERYKQRVGSLADDPEITPESLVGECPKCGEPTVQLLCCPECGNDGCVELCNGAGVGSPCLDCEEGQ
ncbi:hypothetical protein LCGC14_1239340 [marine sediment metagenome]|uniref:Uncharacterized protein n=1 Tax=marine sediment metagenome TaxID=412755 RepID=A0A0F9LAE8_9ZZZZ